MTTSQEAAVPRTGVALEIAVQDARGTLVAHEAGADRVELCVALGVGGLTPSLGIVEASVATGVETHVLVRSRGGGFVFDDDEIAVMVRDIELAVAAGATGVVVGALRAGVGPSLGLDALDLDALARFVAAADGREVTVHRCVDVLTDPLAALDALVDLGVTRILTSGGAARAREGVERIAELTAAAGDRLQVMAGGGVRTEDVATLVDAGVAAVHLSARGSADHAGPAGPGGGVAAFDVTDPALVRAAARALGR